MAHMSVEGQVNLHQFTWRKKEIEEAKKGEAGRGRKRTLEERQAQLDKELEEVRLQKIKSQAERDAREEEWQAERRQQDMESFLQWEKKGDDIAVQQLLERREERYKAGKPRPVDILSRCLDYLLDKEDASTEIEQVEFPDIVNCMQTSDLEEIKKDLEVFFKVGQDKEFWKAVYVLCDDRIELLNSKGVKRRKKNSGVCNAAVKEAFKSLKKASIPEIKQVAKEAEQSGDVEFWQALKPKVRVAKAMVRLASYHQRMMEKVKKQEQERREGEDRRAKDSDDEDLEDEDSEGEEDPLAPKVHAKPSLHLASSDNVVDEASEEENRKTRLLEKYAETMAKSTANDDNLPQQTETDKFADEVQLADKGTLAWMDKYIPRKPKYFNRVHTGYEWNKYNQTHYDYDNPPPKVVMGYKFNIFYPDLVDTRQEPKYFIEATEKGWDDDVCIVRFHAGPPYEDIAFKVVNRPWRFIHRRGFRCTFEKGVFHLYFNFERFRYRR